MKVAYDVISRRRLIRTLRIGQDLNILGRVPIVV